MVNNFQPPFFIHNRPLSTDVDVFSDCLYIPTLWLATTLLEVHFVPHSSRYSAVQSYQHPCVVLLVCLIWKFGNTPKVGAHNHGSVAS